MSDVKKWLGPNPNRQVKQLSFRPAVHIMAKLETLEEIFKNRNRTELINDMLDRALREVQIEIMDIGGHRDDLQPDDDGYYIDLTLSKKFDKVYSEKLEKYQSIANTEDD
jgi:hypothetical protein